MASTTSEPKYDANKADYSDEGALAEHDSRDFDEKNDASLNPPVENAPKSNGPATPADSAPPVTDVIPKLCPTSAKPKFRHDHYQKPECFGSSF